MIAMLDTRTEKETLPKCNDDLTIPTKAAFLETHINYLNEQIKILQGEVALAEIDKATLLKRAKEVGVTEDSQYKIVEVPVYPKKRVDVERLKRYKDKYDLIIQNIKSRIADKADSDLQKADVFISQADVKAVIRDKATLAMVIPEQTEIERWETTIVKK